MDRYSKWRSALNAGGNDMSNSHPSTPQRIEIARRHARAIGPFGTRKRERERFLQGIDGMLFGDTAKEGYIRGNSYSHAKLGITFTVPSDFELSNRAEAVLAAGPDQMALRFDAVSKKGVAANPVAYLKSGWVNGLREDTVQATTINDHPGASARALAGDWQFIITVVDFGGRYYRFILAAPRSAGNIDKPGLGIPASFRTMTRAEKAALKPLRIKVVPVGASDTIALLASRMAGVSRKVDLFRALNGLGPGDRVKTGEKVKIVVDR